MNKKQRKSSRSKNGIYRMMKIMSVQKLAKRMGVKIIKNPNLLYIKENEEIVEEIDEILDDKVNNETNQNNHNERKIIKPNTERKAFEQQYQVDISKRNIDKKIFDKKFESYVKWKDAEIADIKRRESLLCAIQRISDEER